jgi:hypothetical protein
LKSSSAAGGIDFYIILVLDVACTQLAVFFDLFSSSFLNINTQQQELAAIWNMGFDADIVQRALLQADGNEGRAVELIVTDR